MQNLHSNVTNLQSRGDILNEEYANNGMAYLGRHILIKENIEEMANALTQENNVKVTPEELNQQLKSLSFLLSGYGRIEPTDKLFDTVSKACTQIRKKRLIVNKLIRVDICTYCINRIQKYITKCSNAQNMMMACKLTWAVSHIVYDVEMKMPEFTRWEQIDQFLKNLTEEYYRYGVLPKVEEDLEVPLDIDDEYGKVVFQDWIENVNMKSNNVIFVSGAHGAGKSLTALDIAMQLDLDFEMDKQIVYDTHEFISLCNQFKQRKDIGKVIIYDEVGVGASSNSSWEKINNILDQYLQLFRFLRLTVIFTAKDEADSIKKLRKRFTHYIWLKERRKADILKINSKYNIQKEKQEYQIKGFTAEDEYNKYNLSFVVRKVPKDLEDQYESIKDNALTGKHLDRLEEEARLECNGMLEVDMIRDFMEKHMDNPEAWTTKKDKDIIDTEFLEEEYRLGNKRARQLRADINKKIRQNRKKAQQQDEVEA